MNNASTAITVTAGDLSGLLQQCAAAGKPLMIHGSPGIGKSYAALDAAHTMAEQHKCDKVVQLGDAMSPKDYGYFDIRLINFGPEEFGLPSLDPVRGVQVRNPVDWFPSTDRTDLPDHGLLIFEEAVSVSPAMQATMFQITNERRLGDKKLKPGWAIALTGNHLTDGGVVFKMPTPLANRLIHVYVVSDADSWDKWATEHGIEPVLQAFIRFRPELLNTFADHVKARGKDHAFATERQWETVNRLQTSVTGEPHPALMAGAVGLGPATEYAAFRKMWADMPSIDGILMDPAGSPVPTGAATRFAVCTALATRTTGGNFGTVCQYVERLPAEYAVMTIKDCMRRHGGAVTATAAFLKAASKYSEFLQ